MTAQSADRPPTQIVRGVSIEVMPGQTTVLVGQSGCGKSTVLSTALDILPVGLRRNSGDVVLDDVRLDPASEAMAKARGRQLALIFQEPGAALNPSLSIGRHFQDTIRGASVDWRSRALELLAEVGVDEGEKRLKQHAHQLSGGERQRVVIALAIANNPTYLLADEPTSALDPVTSKRVLELLQKLRDSRGLGLLLVTHEWRVVMRYADQVLVMLDGSIVESGAAAEVLRDPTHAETKRLLAAAQIGGVDA